MWNGVLAAPRGCAEAGEGRNMAERGPHHAWPRSTPLYRILLVDDEPATLAFYAAILEGIGHEVTTRTQALGTAPAIIKERPDYVLLDVEMPGLHGHEIVRVLSRRPGKRKTRFVLLSSKREAELSRLAQSCGADGYLCKTSDRSAFLNAFVRVLQAAPPQRDGA